MDVSYNVAPRAHAERSLLIRYVLWPTRWTSRGADVLPLGEGGYLVPRIYHSFLKILCSARTPSLRLIFKSAVWECIWYCTTARHGVLARASPTTFRRGDIGKH